MRWKNRGRSICSRSALWNCCAFPSMTNHTARASDSSFWKFLGETWAFRLTHIACTWRKTPWLSVSRVKILYFFLAIWRKPVFCFSEKSPLLKMPIKNHKHKAPIQFRKNGKKNYTIHCMKRRIGTIIPKIAVMKKFRIMLMISVVDLEFG